MAKFLALIPAAGSGSRIGETLPKQYLSLANKPMIYHTINIFYHARRIDHICIILSPDDKIWSQYDWSEFSDKLIVLNCGGTTRAESVLNGLKTVPAATPVNDQDWILVHDAARPCLSDLQLESLINKITNDETGGILAIPVADTLKRSDNNFRIISTESREHLWQAQTPQMFRYHLLFQALSQANTAQVTDDASAIEALGYQPKLVLGDTHNLKVTYPQDLKLAEIIIKYQQGEKNEQHKNWAGF